MRCAIVGEAWGETEESLKLPFMGAAGAELTKWCLEAGLRRSNFFITNVFNFRPKNNDLSTICLDKVSAMRSLELCRQRNPSDTRWPTRYAFQPLHGAGKYLDPQWLPELWRLTEELSSRKIELAIALGNTACWALLGHTGIGRLRGFEHRSTLLPDLKVLPTYHPASIFRNFSSRPVCIADFQKVGRLIAGESTSRIQRNLWIEPTLADIQAWARQFVRTDPISVDVETSHGQITCIGFGVPQSAICIPFWDRRRPDWNYWADAKEEHAAMLQVREILVSDVPKVYQNGGYDLQYLWRTFGLVSLGLYEDTMLIHHALQPEMQKDLSFLGSVYTDVLSWKGMRKRAKLAIASDKRED